jgi:hypothetical protein
MKNIYIFIQALLKENITWEIPHAGVIKEKLPDLILFDFDSYSDSFLVDQAIKLMEDAGRILILIRAEPGIQGGSILRLFNQLPKQKNAQILTILEGNNLVIEKMLKVLDKDKIKAEINPELQKKILLEFFNN